MNEEHKKLLQIKKEQYKLEQKDVPFPKDIDLNELMKVIPETTNSVLGTGKKYRDYSFDDLRKMGVNKNDSE